MTTQSGSPEAALPAADQTPGDVAGYRARLSQGGNAIDPETWAGSLPTAQGIGPRVRLGRDRWFNLLWLLPIGFVGLIVAVAVAQGLRHVPAVQRFIGRYPGMVASPDTRPGLPWWVDAQHFLNVFFMIFIIRAGIQILADHPRLYWTRHSTPGRDWFRFQRPVPTDPLWTAKQDSVGLPRHLGLPGLRHSIGLARWWHLGVDVLWLVNGAVFYLLLFATGQWRRIVPTTWKVFPSAASVLIQYLSLHWPIENGWAAYNGLQLLAYFITVFVAAPAALITGLGMAPALSTRLKSVSRRLSIQVARSLHFLVLCWFLFFIVVHVTLVFSTGLLHNLNHIYAVRNDASWVGFGVFCCSMVLLVVAWVAATPFTLRHPRVVQRVGFALVGPFQRLFEHVDASPGQYTERDLSPYFWHNGAFPTTAEYQRLFDGGFADWRLKIHGLVGNPVELTLDELRALEPHDQISQHFCIQGWSGIAKWSGVSMQTILELVRPAPEARWVVFYSLGDGPDGGLYYDAHPIEQMRYRLTMLAYEMNGQPLSYGHGAPLRLRNEIQLGFKQVKWLAGIEFVANFSEVGGGYGGYNPDHEFFGYRQSI
ncbi:MAG TPA: molybdopterin-dependent oxidoreductase [Actinomycetota bacterium]|nr:molybdopterin-dependent oxidoreductase [Actinomycetota bacterium]